jgi:hypothetical protein
LACSIHVDDIFLTASEKELERFMNYFSSVYDLNITDGEEFLGMDLIYSKDKVEMRQDKLLEEVLRDLDLLKPQARAVATPMREADRNLPRLNGEGERPFLNRDYLHHIGKIRYLTLTSPEILYALNSLARHSQHNGSEHMSAVRHLGKFLKTIRGTGLTYTTVKPSDLVLTGFVDASFADDIHTRRSTTGYILYLGPAGYNPIEMRSKRQSFVTVSSCESEIVALAEIAMAVLYYRKFLKEFGLEQKEPTLVRIDNQAAKTIAEENRLSKRTRHLDVRFLKVCELIADGVIRLEYVESKANTADVFTKPVDKETLRRHWRAVRGEERWDKINQEYKMQSSDCDNLLQ